MGEIIKVHTVDKQATDVSVNGRRVSVPSNTDFPLADAYVEALENSHVPFSRLGSVADKKCAGYFPDADIDELPGAGAPEARPAGQVPGADSLTHVSADERLAGGTLVIASAPVNQVPGGDNLTHGGRDEAGITAELEILQTRLEEAKEPERGEIQAEIDRLRRSTLAGAIEVANDAALAARDGTQPPAAELVNTGTNQDDTAALERARLSGEAPQAAEPAPEAAAEPGPLDKSIPDLTAYLDGVDDTVEIDRLIAAETAGKSRKGALDALEARRTVLIEGA
jgi:hypothetical protein